METLSDCAAQLSCPAVIKLKERYERLFEYYNTRHPDEVSQYINRCDDCNKLMCNCIK